MSESAKKRAGKGSNLPDIPDVLYLVRLEHNERRFARVCGDDADGVVVPGRFDAPPLAGSRRAHRGERGTELKEQALAARHPVVLIDPETWRFPFVEDTEAAERDGIGRTAATEAVRLPLTADMLATPRSQEALVRATLRMQVDATWQIAPYFLFRSVEDPWLKVNTDLIELAVALGGEQTVGAAIYVPQEALYNGTLELAAERYAKVLPRGATVILTVCDMQPTVPASVITGYLTAVQALLRAGMRVIVDRASELCVAAVALGASGAITGTRLYRTAAPSPLWQNEFNPLIKTSYFVPGRCERMNVQKAVQRNRRRSIPACRERRCDVLNGTARPIELRLHNAHALRRELRHARLAGPKVVAEEWREYGLVRLTAWAQALEEAQRRSERA